MLLIFLINNEMSSPPLFSIPLRPVSLEGYGIVLRPMMSEHEVGLAEAATDGKLWEISYAGVPRPERVADYICHALAEQKAEKCLAFTVIAIDTNTIIGSSRYYNSIPECARLEIGYTWLAQSYQGTVANTAAKYLMMGYAFEHLNIKTIGWRTDILNSRSQHAIERLGAKKDGVIRGDKLRRNGTVRDSVIYSMTREEWEENKVRLLARLTHHDGVCSPVV